MKTVRDKSNIARDTVKVNQNVFPSLFLLVYFKIQKDINIIRKHEWRAMLIH